MERTLTEEIPQNIGKIVRIVGWVKEIKKHGDLVFMDIADSSGRVQVIIIPDHLQAYKKMEKVITKHAIELVGLVKESPACTRDDTDPLKCIEIEAQEIKILNESIGEDSVKNTI